MQVLFSNFGKKFPPPAKRLQLRAKYVRIRESSRKGGRPLHVLAVIGIVLGAIALLIGLILSLPIVILVSAQTDRPLTLRYRLLFFPFREKDPDKPKGALSRIVGRLLGFSPLNSARSAQSAVRSRGVSGTLGQLVSALRTLIDAILQILPFVRLRRLKLRAVCAGEDAADAAMDYGAACAVVYPLIGYLETVFKTRPNAADVRISCDFSAPESSYALEAALSVTIFRILQAAIRLIRRNMQNEVYQPSPKEDNHGT